MIVEIVPDAGLDRVEPRRLLPRREGVELRLRRRVEPVVAEGGAGLVQCAIQRGMCVRTGRKEASTCTMYEKGTDLFL